MCRFIILLLLLCNNQCHTKDCSCIEERNRYSESDCGCDKKYWNERKQTTEREYEHHENCACTACEGQTDDSSEKTDSRTIYLNTSAVKQN